MKLNLPGLGSMPPVDRAALRRDGFTLFSKLIRTKNVDALQGEPEPLANIRGASEDESKVKLQVSQSAIEHRYHNEHIYSITLLLKLFIRVS